MLANLWDGAQNFATAWGDYLEAEAQGLALNTADEPYENSRSETDQIIAFFEREFDGREEIFGPFMDEEQSVQLTQLRVKYLNCTNSIDHQNEQITVAMEDMFAKRAEFTGLLHTCPSTIRLGRLTAQAVAEVNHLPQTAPLLRSLETLKLDINDRKNTRFFKERERQDTAEPLAAAIANIKIGQFESCKVKFVPPPVAWTVEAGLGLTAGHAVGCPAASQRRAPDRLSLRH
jgi:hypothetical protein